MSDDQPTETVRAFVDRLDDLDIIDAPDDYDVEWSSFLPSAYYDEDGDLVYWRTDVPIEQHIMTGTIPSECPNCGVELDATNTGQETVNGETTVYCGQCGHDLTPDSKVNYKSPVESDNE